MRCSRNIFGLLFSPNLENDSDKAPKYGPIATLAICRKGLQNINRSPVVVMIVYAKDLSRLSV